MLAFCTSFHLLCVLLVCKPAIDCICLQYKSSGFEVYLMQKANILMFEPQFKTFSEGLLSVLNQIVEAVMIVPRLETKLYFDYEGPPRYLKVRILYILPYRFYLLFYSL